MRAASTADPDSLEYESENRFNRRLWRMLHRPTRAKSQYRDPVTGEIVYGRAEHISFGAFDSHMLAQCTRAVSCVAGENAIFMALDIDKRFRERLPIIRDLLASRGLARAAFGTEGSDSDRGKVIVTLAQPIPQAQAVRLVRDLLATATRHPEFGRVEPGEVVGFPNRGGPAGNTVRVFGRNPKRGGGLEAPLSLNGDLWDLYGLTPALIEKEQPLRRVPNDTENGTPGRAFRARLPVSSGTPGRYAGNGATIFGDMLKWAWDSSTEADFAARCEAVLSQSDLTAGTREQLARPDVRQRAWQMVVTARRSSPKRDRVGDWLPLASPPAGIKPRSPVWRIYTSAADFAVSSRQNPHCIRLAYSLWAELAGYTSKGACGKIVLQAEKCGLLLRVDRGEPVPGGPPTMICLVGEGESLQEAFDSALASDEYQQRLKDRAAQRPIALPAEATVAAQASTVAA